MKIHISLIQTCTYKDIRQWSVAGAQRENKEGTKKTAERFGRGFGGSGSNRKPVVEVGNL